MIAVTRKPLPFTKALFQIGKLSHNRNGGSID
jgi:hypothetical protein